MLTDPGLKERELPWGQQTRVRTQILPGRTDHLFWTWLFSLLPGNNSHSLLEILRGLNTCAKNSEQSRPHKYECFHPSSLTHCIQPIPLLLSSTISIYEKFISNKFTGLERIKTKASYGSQMAVMSHFFSPFSFSWITSKGMEQTEHQPVWVRHCLRMRANQHVKNVGVAPSYSKPTQFKVYKMLPLQVTAEFGCTYGSVFIHLY